MPTCVDDFISDPLDFMGNNIVVTPEGGGSLESGGVKYFTLTLQKSKGRKFDAFGGPVLCYLAHPTSTGMNNGILMTYWCPYVEGELRTTVAGNGANYLFTAPMNGCSFGIGSPTPKGERLVGHSNLKGSPDKNNTQNKCLVVSKLGAGLVDPNFYMKIAGNDPVLVTTFGVRNPLTRSWKFYYQLSTSATGDDVTRKTLYGVFPVI